MKFKTVPRISETEWELMRVVWARHPVTAGEIIKTLIATDPSWHPKTARTLLARLVKKRALDYESDGRRYVYEPLVTERECIQAASTSFLDRVFGGSLQTLLAHFVQQHSSSPEELAELKRLLERPPKTRKKNRTP
jgi:BlaI family penicillinase repressor